MKIIQLIMIVFPLLCFGQSSIINGYKYTDIESNTVIGAQIRSDAERLGLIVVDTDINKWPQDLKSNPCLLLRVSWTVAPGGIPNSAKAWVRFVNCNDETVYERESLSSCFGCYYKKNSSNATKKAMRGLTYYGYKFDPSKTPTLKVPEVELISETESSLKEYYDSNILHELEGIYKSTSSALDNTYTVGIKNFDGKLKGVVIESGLAYWKKGEVKFILEETATKGIFSCTYFTGEKIKKELFLINEQPGLLTFNIQLASEQAKITFVKMYPSNNNSISAAQNSNWKGNGSGLFVSSSGYIVTNHHVIENASNIEIEYFQNEKLMKMKAEVVQKDKNNDLAVLKIVDDQFYEINQIPYSFKSSTSDVGTEVFALGYPMALSVMGKEIKFTDGKISSKTGYQGDITTYQSTVPLQPGNSGGPMFDLKGNLIGINSSGIRSAENVSYTIKSNYLLSLIESLPGNINLPSSSLIDGKPLTEQIKVLSDYVVLIKVK